MPVELAKASWRNGVKLMIDSFTEPCEDPKTAKWMPSTPQKLEEIGKYFTPKDTAVLEHVYREHHEVTKSEVDSIVGKMLPVSED